MNKLVSKDFRVKLTPENKEAIKKIYATGISIRQLAILFHLPYSTARYVVSPSFRQAKRDWAAKNWKRYYTTDNAREWKRKYRYRKRDV